MMPQTPSLVTGAKINKVSNPPTAHIYVVLAIYKIVAKQFKLCSHTSGLFRQLYRSTKMIKLPFRDFSMHRKTL